MQKRKKILWLVSWYPNKYDLFDGDFIQRHAKAAALHHDVHVLFIKQFEDQRKLEESIAENGGLTEQLIYLPKQKGVLGKLTNHREWLAAYKRYLKRLLQKEAFNLVHVHVPWKVGLIALWTKKRFGIPYVVTEHWGIYNNVVDDNIHRRNKLVRRLLKRIYAEAAAFVSVSKFLGDAVNETLVKKDFTVIPNVVDTNLFYRRDRKESRFTFLHVSNMVPLKNVEGIIAAFQIFLQESKADTQLVLVGNKDDQYPSLASKTGLLNTHIFFKGEVPYGEVAKEMQRSHVLVLNSNIENSPCVIGEALCCGLPVIATNVGGIPELVNEKNGLLVPPQNAEALAKAMLEIFQNHSRYNAWEIALAAVQKFSIEAIGADLSIVYERVLASAKAQ